MSVGITINAKVEPGVTACIGVITAKNGCRKAEHPFTCTIPSLEGEKNSSISIGDFKFTGSITVSADIKIALSKMILRSITSEKSVRDGDNISFSEEVEEPGYYALLGWSL